MQKWVAGGVLGVLAAVTVLLLQGGSSSHEVPVVTIRGVTADPGTFSLTTLRTREQHAFVESVRRDVYEACMVDKGFGRAPNEDDFEAGGERAENARAWYKAASGDDGKSYTQGPPLQPDIVQLADGREVEIFVDWTPETCMYRSFTELGVDALVREALRQTLMLLIHQADQAALDALESVAERWGDCVGDDVDSQDLIGTLNALDGMASSHSPYGGAASTCLTGDLRSEAMRIRADEHLRVAANNDAVIQQWVKVLDREIKRAQQISG